MGLFLLSINIFGLFKSMRNPALYTEEKTSRVNDVTIKWEDAKKAIARKPDESDKDFALRINDVVSKSMSHYWKKEGLKKYYMQVPVWENYILYTSSLFKKDKAYEFKENKYIRNLERG
ncbi:hypothetical protein MNBD_BACTEROID01-544, partial [hydrothermal vent metagenome]